MRFCVHVPYVPVCFRLYVGWVNSVHLWVTFVCVIVWIGLHLLYRYNYLEKSLTILWLLLAQQSVQLHILFLWYDVIRMCVGAMCETV